MNGAFSRHSLIYRAILLGSLGLACCETLAGCQQVDATPTVADVAIMTGHSAEIGSALESDQWTVKLIEAPYTSAKVGAGGGEHYQFQELGAAEAEGVFVILPVELTNGGDDIRMFGKSSGLVVADSQGRETPLAQGRPHLTLTYSNIDRWGEFENQIFQNPMEAGVTWDGPLVFDVPKDATGLRLQFLGSDKDISLGL